MPGPVKQFVDFSINTASDTGADTPVSVQPVNNGEVVDQTTLNRPSENLRQRTEAIRSLESDSLYLRDADRSLILTGPGKVSWPGSTTVAASGIPTISDNLYLLPMLTPGFPQTAPVPPVASAYGKIHLKRASDSLDSILVTSRRRSYAGGDQINITVIPGSTFAVTLDAANSYRRTITIVAIVGTTTLAQTITGLLALTPTAPDNAPLVLAVLEGGALGSDLLLSTQAKQYMAGNYDGEGHVITPANVASFFVSNPTQALAEGDTLCAYFPMVSDTTAVGGRRQAIPENSNTAIAASAFFNSRVRPEYLVNALPICKVVSGALVFSTGTEIAAGDTNVSLSAAAPLSPFIRNGGFAHGVTGATNRFAVSNWENRADLAVNGAFQLGTAIVDTGGKSLEFVKTTGAASTTRIDQVQELPVTPGQTFRVSIRVRQMIAPTAGTYFVGLYWGDNNSAASGSNTMPFQSIGVVDGSFRTVTLVVTVPAGKRFLKTVTVEAAAVTTAAAGVAAVVDNLQIVLEGAAPADTKIIDETRIRPVLADALVLDDPNTYQLGELAALLRMDKATPALEGRVVLERRDQTYPNLPPALALQGRLLQLGAKLLDTEARALLPRVSADISVLAGAEFTLMWESAREGETIGTYTQAPMRLYGANDGRMLFVSNARFDGTLWNPDVAASQSFRIVLQAAQVRFEYFNGGPTWAEASWVSLSRIAGVANVLEMLNADIVPATDGTRTIGAATKAFNQIWSRYLRVGPAITGDTSKLVQFKSSYGYPAQTAQVDYEHISANFGLLTRAGHRFSQDWDSNTAAPAGWVTATTGAGAGSNTLSATQHRTTVAHNGAGVGTFSLQTIDSVKFRLTDGFVCRVRCNNPLGAFFTMPVIGFVAVGGAGNGITFGPRTVDGGGSHNYQFAVGPANTLVGGPGDSVLATDQRWLTFALVGTKFWWTANTLQPDSIDFNDSAALYGSANITVPAGLFHFVIRAEGGGSGFGSAITVDYVEITTGGRDA
jgi:hypothetical protein